MRIQVIVGSIRQGRIGPQIAGWIKKSLQEAIPGHQVEVIDLKEWHLPMDDEPGLPALGHYQQEHTKAWSSKVSQGHAFIFVTPQYNWGYPAALKNAIDHLYGEWGGKPALIVSYANRGGGKAAAQLKQVLDGVHMLTQDAAIEIKLSQLVIDESGNIRDLANALSPYAQPLLLAVERAAEQADSSSSQPL